MLTTRGASPDAATVDLTAGPDEVTCKIAYEHERAGVSLTLDVEVDGGPLSEGDWMLSAAAGPPDVGPAPGSDLVRGDVDPGEYDLLAAGGAGADEYVTDGWNCGGVSTTPGVSPEAATVDLTAGPPEVTCSIVYTHVPGAVSNFSSIVLIRKATTCAISTGGPVRAPEIFWSEVAATRRSPPRSFVSIEALRWAPRTALPGGLHDSSRRRSGTSLSPV